MLEAYRDITNRLGEPLWWDHHGVPRYDKFTPGDACDVYADEVALLEIVCQECGKIMRVSLNWNRNEEIYRRWPRAALHDVIEEYGVPHYGDPPAHTTPDEKECVAGATMNCIDRAVLEFWTRRGIEDRRFLCDWTRMPEFEKRAQEAGG